MVALNLAARPSAEQPYRDSFFSKHRTVDLLSSAFKVAVDKCKMGFWTVLDKIVGYIPVVETVKDTVEAIVLEAEGKHEAAKEKAMEAAVDLVGDVVTVATFGTGYEVAAAGKMAAEVAIKEATESGAKSVAKAAMQEAVRDGYTKTAAIGIGAAAAGAHTKEKLKDSIAARKGTRRKPTPRGPLKTDKKGKDKDPKRGHHVINNGVRKVLPNIIDDFLHHNAHLFHSLPWFP